MRRPYPFDQQSYAYDHYYNGYTHPSYSHPPYDYYYSDSYPQYNRKRQRRQAAAIVVESLFNDASGNKASTTPTRKSTAQPRPVLTVPPKGIGPIADPNVNDVLCGRGGRINSHAGNVQFRDIIHSKKKEYLAPTTKKLEKAHIAAAIVNDIRTMNPPGRFLKEEKGTGMWYDIGDAKAIKKTGQALREDAPDIRPAIDGEGGSSGDEKPSPKPTKSKVRSPHVSPRGNTMPILPQQQGYNNTDYHGQMSMPPPYHAQRQGQQGYQTRNIPIQVPLQSSRQPSFPGQMYSGVQSASNKISSASRKAMEALSQAGPTIQPQYAQYGGSGRQPDDLAFGMAFHDPVAPRMISDDNTISTISGLSEPISSLSLKSARASGTGTSDLMNMSLKSGISLTDSLRLKSSLRGGSSGHTRQYDPFTSGTSIRSGSNKGFDPMMLAGLNGSVKSFSITRSNSFPDNLSTADNWKYDGDIGELMEETSDRSLIGGGTRRGSSAMSIGSIMDLQSNASSGQWFQAAVGNLPLPDDKSFMSSAMMSADLDALDLASTF